MSSARAQVARLLALVPYIQSREQVPLEQAARDLGVKPAQLVKDLEVLWFCGLPGLGMGDLIDVDMDALGEDGDGVIRVSNADYLARPLRLGSNEASALIVALRALRASSADSERPLVDQVLAKLEAAAGDGAALASQVDVQLDASAGAEAEARQQLTVAIEEGRQVRLGYYVPSRDEVTERTVDPLRVFEADGNSYLDAWCHTAEGERLFRLDRISSVTRLDAPRARPDAQPRDLDEGLFQPSSDDLLARLRLQRPARWVAEYYPTESTEEQPDGTLEVTLRAGDPAWLERLVLRLAPYAEVVAPDGFAARVAERARDALNNYDADDVR